MPGPELQDERRDPRLTNALFWGGVGLAPFAALLLLIGQQGGVLRFAAVLAILAVVLIGLSITLRGNSDAMRVELEEVLYEEVDALRNDVREDIATAARATHKAFGEKLQALYEQLNAIRAQLDAVRAEAGRAGYQRPGAAPIDNAAAVTGQFQGPAAVAGQFQPVPGNSRAAAPGGLVRHTETVQVTTRQTIVDPPHAEGAGRAGTVYGGGAGYGQRGEPNDGAWTDRSRGEGRRARYDEVDEVPYEDRWTEARAGDRWGAVRDDARGGEVRLGERRAALHSDDSGTELRFEDRWASVRRDEPRRDRWADDRDSWRDDRESRREAHRVDEARDGWRGEQADWRDQSGGWRADQTGGWRSEQQADWRDQTGGWRADRDDQTGGWRADQTDWRDDRSGWSENRWSDRQDESRPEASAGWDRGRRALPALPAGGQSSNIWDSEWTEPERQRAGGRRRRDDEDDDRYSSGDRWR